MSVAAPDQVVLVVDFGAQYAQLIARRVRELKVYSEIVPHTVTAAELAERKARRADPLRRPKERPHRRGSRTGPRDLRPRHPHPGDLLRRPAHRPATGWHRRSQRARRVRPHGSHRRPRVPSSLLHDGIPTSKSVWMSHFDAVTDVPDGFAAPRPRPIPPWRPSKDTDRKIYAVQYHPEVVHSPHGMAVLEQFLWRRGCVRGLDHGVDHRRIGGGNPSPSRIRTGHLCAQRWC